MSGDVVVGFGLVALILGALCYPLIEGLWRALQRLFRRLADAIRPKPKEEPEALFPPAYVALLEHYALEERPKDKWEHENGFCRWCYPFSPSTAITFARARFETDIGGELPPVKPNPPPQNPRITAWTPQEPARGGLVPPPVKGPQKGCAHDWKEARGYGYWSRECRDCGRWESGRKDDCPHEETVDIHDGAMGLIATRCSLCGINVEAVRENTALAEEIEAKWTRALRGPSRGPCRDLAAHELTGDCGCWDPEDHWL